MPRIMVLRRGSDRFFPLMDVSGVSLLPVLAFPFLFGILLGTVFGLFSETLPASLNSSVSFSEITDSTRFAVLLWHTVRYIIFAAILSTGYLGVFLLPLLTAFRGFSYACAVSALFGSEGFSGLLFALISIGVPALAELSAFLFVSGYCMHASFSLLPGRRRDFSENFRRFHLRDFLLVSALCTAEVLYCTFLLPLITELLF